MALSKKNRLGDKKEIDRVFKNGRTVKGSSLFIRFLENGKGYARFAFVVPTKHIPLAVGRNRIRRILSGEISRTPSLLGQGLDIIVIVSKKVTKEKFKELAEKLSELLSKI